MNMTAPDDIASVQENPYLALREAKIRRNEARLRELGLVKAQSHSSSSVTKATNANEKPRPKQAATESQTLVTAVRRSKRLSNSSKNINYADVPDPRQPSLKRPRTNTTPSVDEAATNPKPHDVKQSPSPKLVTPPTPNSVRSIAICTQRLTTGSTDVDVERQDKGGILGLLMERAGKEFVIYKSFEVAASLEDYQRLEGARLSFNKYSGVQEWKNCIFLWVNLGAHGNTVVNTFLDGGKQITWFGGSKMTDDSPIIKKLIQWGKEATDSSSKIILWCRKFDTSTKAFSPYVCLGRLSYHHHEPGSRPLEFVWNLLDCERIANHPDAQVRETFQTFIQL
jgi:hypothetical protein